MDYLRPKDVNVIDINSSWLGVDTFLLMENAGNAVASVIKDRFPKEEFENVLFVCGTGNNGGDGFVAARHLASHGYKIHVILLGDETKIRSEEARRNFQILKRMKLSIKLTIIKDSTEIDKLIKALNEANVVVDAILGVGSRGSPRGLYRTAINAINEKKDDKGYRIVSIDVPSGFDGENGLPTEVIIKPDITVTFVKPKAGLDESFAGKIIIANIGQPPEAESFVGPGDLTYILGRRKSESHKGDFGKIMVVGGSKDFYGAPTLTALAALKTGADLSFVYAPEPAADSIKRFSPNLIVRSLDGDYLSKAHIDFLVKEAERVDVIAIGPGLSVKQDVLDATFELIDRLNSIGKKLVIDADGLKALSGRVFTGKNVILTPHSGEFKIITDVELSGDILDKMQKVMEFAKKTNVTVLLKGSVDLITDGERAKYNITGNPGMTVGGTGDVLTGIVSALYAITQDAFKAACAGAFISGAAGDLAYEKYGYSLTATDVLEEIPKVIKRYLPL